MGYQYYLALLQIAVLMHLLLLYQSCNEFARECFVLDEPNERSPASESAASLYVSVAYRGVRQLVHRIASHSRHTLTPPPFIGCAYFCPKQMATLICGNKMNKIK